MRIYGLHSGRNNPSKYLARSYMWYSRKSNNTKSSKQKESCIETTYSPKDVNVDDDVNIVLVWLITLSLTIFFDYLINKSNAGGDNGVFGVGFVLLFIPLLIGSLLLSYGFILFMTKIVKSIIKNFSSTKRK